MTNTKMIKPSAPRTPGETTRWIEEAAYYSWLNRGRLDQPGDEFNDWVEAERKVTAGFRGTRSVPQAEFLS